MREAGRKKRWVEGRSMYVCMYVSITRVHAKSQESSLSKGYDSKACKQINHNNNVVLEPLKIAAATPLIPHRKCTGKILAYVL